MLRQSPRLCPKTAPGPVHQGLLIQQGENQVKKCKNVLRFPLKCLFRAAWDTKGAEVTSAWYNPERLLSGGDCGPEGSLR